jgi:hypothetical protein
MMRRERKREGNAAWRLPVALRERMSHCFLSLSLFSLFFSFHASREEKEKKEKERKLGDQENGKRKR